MEKNGIYEGEVTALGTGGEGIINAEGTTAFVPFCLVGEKVKFKALKVKGGVAYGKVESVINAAYSRVNPPCKAFEKCGGCDLQHMNYAEQLNFKRGLVENALRKIGGISAAVGNVVPCEKELRYRNKLSLPIGVDAGGNTVCGFYAAHSHRIVAVDDCLIQAEWVKQVICAVQRFAKESKTGGYDEVARTGILRRIVVRELGGKYIFALVAAKKINAQPLIKLLEKDFEDFTFLLNINPSQGNAIFGKEWHICRGEGVFEAEEFGIKYSAGADTFLQVNDDVRAKLYARVLEEAGGDAVALDLYSGAGVLTAMLAKNCGTAYGVEINEEASRCADELKDKNGLQGKMFNVCGAVEEKIDGILAEFSGVKKTVVCDPPRKGMERSVVRAIAACGADKIVLISCNPATLARDLGLLCGTLKEENGELIKADVGSAYAIASITPFDMFPQTKHVETLVVLSHKKPDGISKST